MVFTKNLTGGRKAFLFVIAFLMMAVYMPRFAYADTTNSEADAATKSIDVTMRFVNNDGDTVDISPYKAPYTKNGDKLDVTVNGDTENYSLADAEMKVIQGFSATTEGQVDVTKDSSFDDETGIYSIPASCEDANTVITVNVPTTNAMHKKFLSQFSDTPLHVQGSEATTTVDAEKGKGATAKAGSVPISKGDQFLIYHNAIRISQFYYTSDSEVPDWREKYFGDKGCRDDSGLVYGYTLGTHTTDNTLDGKGQTPIVKAATSDTDITKEEKKELNEWLGDTLFYDEDVSTAKADYALTAGGKSVADKAWNSDELTWKTYINNPKCLGVEKTKVLLKGYCAGDGGNGGGKPQIPDDTKLLLTYKGTMKVNSKRHYVFAISCGKLVGDHGSEYQDFFGYFAVPMSDTSGDLEIEKKSSDPDITNDNSNYSLKGAKFGLYQNDTYVPGTVRYTSKDGKASWEGIEPGTYELKELTAPKGFRIAASKNVTIKTGETTTATVTDQPKGMKVSLTKVSTNLGITAGNAKYSLAGAEYGVYKSTEDANKNQNTVATITTDTAGKGTSKEIAFGTYYVKETKPSPGYALDPTVYTVTGAEGDTDVTTVSITSKEKPQNDPVALVLNKLDKETGKAFPLEGADLSGAIYTVTYTDGAATTKVWEMTTDEHGQIIMDEDHKVTGPDFYVNDKGTTCFPIGTVTIKETKAPIGYKLNEKTETIQIVGGTGQTEIIDTFNEIDSDEQVYRGDFEFNKVDPDGKRLANVAFKVTNITDSKTENSTNESHVIVTDENGEFRSIASWNKHTNNTNGNDAAVSEDGTVDSSKLDPEAGIWFEMDTEGNKATTVNDALGALPYGTYQLDELRCEANEGYTLLKGIKVKISRNFDTADKEPVKIGTLTDKKVNIGTTATDGTTGNHNGMVGDTIVINDEVQYEGLEVGKEYVLTGTLMDKATGEKLLVEGKEVTSEVKFTAKTSSGSVTVPFSFSGKDFGGKSVVAFERLHEVETDTDIGTHEDIDDEGQTVHFPEIKTTAKDSQTGDNQGVVTKKETIIDAVKYVGLIPGKEYLVKGTLMNQATGEAIIEDGKKVTAEKKFTPDTPDGTVELTFTVDSTTLAGNSSVVFEDVYQDGIKVATHSDISDAPQTIWYPKVQTTAKDKDTQTNTGSISKKETIIDVVKCTNLVVGKEYTVKGTLMSKETGKALLVGGKKITAEKTFTADKKDMSVELSFTVDSTTLSGTTTVVFEDLYLGPTKVGYHNDLNDKGQSIHYPGVKTTAKDGQTGNHTGTISKTATIIDSVKYTGLTVGKEYTVKGFLMSKETGKAFTVNGKPVTSEKTFTAKTENGSIDLTFKFDSSALEGKTLVVFEDLYQGKVRVGTHSDINDKAQSVTYPKGKTATPKSNPSTPHDGRIVKTSDMINIAAWIILFLAITAVGILIVRRKFKNVK